MNTCKHNRPATKPCPDCASETRAIRTQDERDRAVIARIGGRLSVGLFRRMGWDADAEREATEGIHRTQEARRTFAALPEAAFDWPIYRAAMRVHITNDAVRPDPLGGADMGPCDDYAPDTLAPDPADRDVCTTCYDRHIPDRLEYLRGEIEAERISYSEIADLQDLAEHIEPGDVVLLQWAGVPEGEARALAGDR